MTKLNVIYKSEGRDFSLVFFNREEERKADLDQLFDINQVKAFLKDCIESSITTFEDFQNYCKQAEQLYQCEIHIDEEVKIVWKGADGTRLLELQEESEAKERNGGILPSDFKTTSQKCKEAIDTFVASFGEEANIGADYDYSEGYNTFSKADLQEEFINFVIYNSYDEYSFLNEDEDSIEDSEDLFTELDDYDDEDNDDDEYNDDDEDFH